MVHALHETWRVLKPNSYVIDLRPTSEPGRVGLVQAGRFDPIGKTESYLEDFLASEAALAQAKSLNLFYLVSTSQFPLIVTFASPGDLSAWLYDFYESMPITRSDQLVRHVKEAVMSTQPPAKIIAVVPFILHVLRKLSV